MDHPLDRFTLEVNQCVSADFGQGKRIAALRRMYFR
jgi:hypothetical protein